MTCWRISFRNFVLESNLELLISMEIFQLKQDEDYIELNTLLKAFQWVSSGGEGKMAIKEGNVVVNGEVETRVRKKMRSGDTVHFNGEEGSIK